MSLTLSLHLVAGLGALALAGGVLLLDRRRPRNRHFALLGLALALWNLGLFGHAYTPIEWRAAARAAYLVGSCATGPLALQFALGLAGLARHLRRRVVTLSSIASLGLWAAGCTVLRDNPDRWSLFALLVLGPMLILAALSIGTRAYRLPPGPQRRAHAMIFAGGLLAVAGGLSDFLPRDPDGPMPIGPITVLLFLLLVCSVVVRHRFLDVHVFLIRAVALVVGSATVALIYYATVRWVDPSAGFLTFLLTSSAVIALAVPLGRRILGRARDLLLPDDPVSRTLQRVSRQLTRVETTDEIWRVLDEGCADLPGDTRVEIYLRRDDQRRFHPVFLAGAGSPTRGEPIPEQDPLPAWLERERHPVTRGYLEAEGVERDAIQPALERMNRLGYRLAVPLLRGDRLIGWLGVALADALVTGEAATSFLAVGNQATASLERLEALELARRRESLAAVGALAAGLAHEVRNPVAAIHGAAQALGPEATSDQREEMREVIEQESARLGRFVGEFLDYARPRSPRREPIDLKQALELAFRRAALAGRRLEGSIETDGGATTIDGDADDLSRLLDNLLRNAWEAGGDGVGIQARLERGVKGRLLLSLEDDGPGIPDEQLDGLFRPFQGGGEGGAGLGLALVHRIVESHQGTIRVEGRYGSGARFTLAFPEADPRAGDPS